jgi:hypothetical protein
LIVWLAAAAWAATVEGRVVERGNADPIAGAVVRVGDQRVTTGSDGAFVLDLADGVWSIVVEEQDHLPVTVEVEVPVARKLVVALAPVPPPLEVVVESFRPSPDVSHHSLDAEQAYETPGVLDDGVRLVQSLPGVTVQREYAPGSGALSVRGSAPGDNRYYLDGIEVPYLYHFNQYASVYPSSQLARLDLYSSTFGAAFGDATGAVVEAESSLVVPESVAGSAFANFVMVGGAVSAPVGKGWWVGLSGRRSYQDLAGERTDQYTVWPVFYDFSARVERATSTGSTGLFAWGAGDRYARAIAELDALDAVEAAATPTLDYRRAFQVFGVRHTWSVPGQRGRVVAAVVPDHLSAVVGDAGAAEVGTVSTQARFDHEQSFGAHRLDVGAEVRGERTALGLDDVDAATALLVSTEAPQLARGEAVDAAGTRVRGGVYATPHLVAGPLRFMPGARLSFDAWGGVDVDPRVATRLRVSDATMLKVAGGRYHQSVETVDLLPRGAVDLGTARSWQVAGGVEQTIAGRLELQLDGYGKWDVDPLFVPVDGPPENVAGGVAWGVELVSRYRLRETFFLWGWLAYARAFYLDEGARWSAPGDQPVTGGLVASWDITEAFNVGVRYRYGSGLPFTPVDSSLYDAGNDAWVPVAGEPGSARMPAYQKLDLHFGWTATFERWSLETSAEAWIVPKSAAAMYPIWSDDWSEQGFVRGPTFLPLLGLRARF